jgi:hypothetical protein
MRTRKWKLAHATPEATLAKWREQKRRQRARWARANGCAWCGCPRVEDLSLCDICREIRNQNARDWRARHPNQRAAYNAARRVARQVTEVPRDRWPASVYEIIEV